MASSSRKRRLDLSLEIARTGSEMAPCTHCRHAKPRAGQTPPKCIVGVKSGKCSECVRKGYSDCDVTLSASEWERFRKTRDKLRADLEKADEEEISLLLEQRRLLDRISSHKAKKIRLRKQLRLAENRTDGAVAKELEALEAEEAAEPVPEPDEAGVVVDESLPSGWDMSVFDWDGLCDPSVPLDTLESFPVGSSGG